MDERIINLYEYLASKKCKDIAVYEIKNGGDSQYIFVITNTSVALNKKFAQMVMSDMELEIFPEGYHKGEWIVFDFGQIIIHSFIPSVREKYSLDKLYHSKKIAINKQNKK